jgi:endonuclease YncB( thermonuclease family)
MRYAMLLHPCFQPFPVCTGGDMRRGLRLGRSGGWAGAAVVVILLAIVTAVSGSSYLIASEDARRPPLDEQLTALSLPPGVSLADLERAEVAAIVDGDTITAKLEDGRTLPVRYFGIDTPERGDRCFREATDRNEALLGDTVLLLEDERLEDSSNRLLRYIFLEDGTSLDATLVAEGFAEAWRADGYYRDELVALEGQARAAGRGCLWG